MQERRSAPDRRENSRLTAIECELEQLLEREKEYKKTTKIILEMLEQIRKEQDRTKTVFSTLFWVAACISAPIGYLMKLLFDKLFG
jgi:hypothetical protein